jgi:hypothetical protein
VSPGNAKSGEPIETLRTPERLLECVGHLNRAKPFRILLAELSRQTRSQWIAERIGDGVVGVVDGKDGLGMRRRSHFDALGEVVVAVK